MLEINKVYQGDCLEVMELIADRSIDMILCDLPYQITACKWDIIIPFIPLWKQYKRVIKDRGAIVLTATQPFTSTLVMSNIEMFKYEWIWNKSRALGFFNAKHKPMNKQESILVFSKGDCANRCHLRMNYNPQNLIEVNKKVNGTRSCIADSEGHRFARPSHKKERVQRYTNFPDSVLTIPSEGGTVHPTQKPVALCEYLIKTYTNEGDIVLDNCAGSGTTGVACRNTGRNFILIEREERYVEIINQRLFDNQKIWER